MTDDKESTTRQRWPAGLIEELAALEHARWAGWEIHRETAVGKIHRTGEPNEERWQRQRETPYAELPEIEKESDRIEVYKTLRVLEAYGVALGVRGD